MDLGQLQNRQLSVAGMVFKGYVHPTLAEPPMDDVLLPFLNVDSLNGVASPRIAKGVRRVMVLIVLLCAIGN